MAHPLRWRQREALDLQAIAGTSVVQAPDAIRQMLPGQLQCNAGCRGEDHFRLLAPAPGVALEVAREHLADRIWRLHHSGACYGLKIQTINLAPSRGVRHRDACLEALATA